MISCPIVKTLLTLNGLINIISFNIHIMSLASCQTHFLLEETHKKGIRMENRMPFPEPPKPLLFPEIHSNILSDIRVVLQSC